HQNYYYENYGGSNETVSAVIPVFNFLNMDWVYGESIICNLNIYELFEALRNITLEKNGQVILLDNNGRSIFRNNFTPIYLSEIENLKEKIIKLHNPFFTIIDGNESAIVHTISEISGWSVIAIIPKNELMSHITPLKYIFLVIAASLLFILSVSYNFMNRLITKPIENIIGSMEKIEKGNFAITVNENTTTETGLLSSKINSLVTNIVKLNRKIFSFQLQNKEAQIKVLQSQINPHFLFNTLQLLKSSAVNEGNKETGQIITSLGSMLRYGIYHQEELVSLDDELNHLSCYLDIQSKRFPFLLNCSIECPEELRNRKTIKLILQPIVENSINHNKLYNKSIDIKIKISTASNNLTISILDNGNGVTEKKLEEIQHYIKDLSMEDKGDSIGLKNVHNRIFLKFGSPYGARIFSEEGKGFRIELLLPDIKCEENKNETAYLR
ncbi:MAG: histidine kinase, partial [Spirochaetia bacterium]|nr:histidine kinase [Spirochaetia bacterium]